MTESTLKKSDWPVFRSLASFRPSDLPGDLIAGLTLAAIAIPEQMATARLGGFSPQIGFFAFIAGSLGFAMLGGNRFLSCGADSTITPIFAGGLALLATSGSPDYQALAVALALLVGVILVVGSLFRLGWIANLLSTPVTVGFLAGISVHILVSQMPGVGLVVKMQTLDTSGRVLEQAAFSELQIDAPIRMSQLMEMMGKVEGYRVEKSPLLKTTASAEGWAMKAPVPGFKSMNCYKRPAGVTGGASRSEALQWIFSDGLASVSVFVEPFERQRHEKETSLSLGATQTLTRHMGDFWVTVMGEVPMTTLRLFANNLERRK